MEALRALRTELRQLKQRLTGPMDNSDLVSPEDRNNLIQALRDGVGFAKGNKLNAYAADAWAGWYIHKLRQDANYVEEQLQHMPPESNRNLIDDRSYFLANLRRRLMSSLWEVLDFLPSRIDNVPVDLPGPPAAGAGGPVGGKRRKTRNGKSRRSRRHRYSRRR